MASLPDYLSPDEYLAIEREAEFKSEYIDGVMYAMAGASERHNAIVANLIISIGVQLRGRDCQVYPSDLKIAVPNSTGFFYPDVSVVCGEPIFADEHKDVIINPWLIVEVLSESTAGFDRGRKFLRYQQINSLKEYVLVDQTEPRVEKFVRQPNDNWLYSQVSGIDEQVILTSIQCELSVKEVYEKLL